MSKVIEEYLKKANTNPVVLKRKLSKYQENKDIMREFEYWIETKNYVSETPVSVCGYTAEKIAKLSKFLNGEGAFAMLIELRENPDRALLKLKENFKIK